MQFKDLFGIYSIACELFSFRLLSVDNFLSLTDLMLSFGSYHEFLSIPSYLPTYVVTSKFLTFLGLANFFAYQMLSSKFTEQKKK